MIPANTTYPQGQGSVSGDNLNTFVQTCQTASQLRGFIGLAGMVVLLDGITAPGDGFGGLFQWVAGATAPDDNSTIIEPNGVTSGRWILCPIRGVSNANNLAVLSMRF